MKRSRIVALAALILLAVAAGYFLLPGQAPAGQPGLTILDAHELSGLREEFNRSSNSLRVILLLSPT
jgi:hypothetical protein